MAPSRQPLAASHPRVCFYPQAACRAGPAHHPHYRFAASSLTTSAPSAAACSSAVPSWRDCCGVPVIRAPIKPAATSPLLLEFACAASVASPCPENAPGLSPSRARPWVEPLFQRLLARAMRTESSARTSCSRLSWCRARGWAMHLQFLAVAALLHHRSAPRRGQACHPHPDLW